MILPELRSTEAAKDILILRYFAAFSMKLAYKSASVGSRRNRSLSQLFKDLPMWKPRISIFAPSFEKLHQE